MTKRVEGSKGVYPVILDLIIRYFPNAEGPVTREFSVPGFLDTYTFTVGEVVYRLTIDESKSANWHPTLEDYHILVVDTWTMGKGKASFKRGFTKEGKEVLEKQAATMRGRVKNAEQAHYVEQNILSIVTGRLIADLPADAEVPDLATLPSLDLNKLETSSQKDFRNTSPSKSCKQLC
jgi:hypothetical protein